MYSKWFYFDTGYLSGDYNMAFDSILSSGYINRPCLRFYQWNPYALSLGYNQTSDCIFIDKLVKAGIDLVRRPTGGRAVLHAEELTYSIVIPSTHNLFLDNIHLLYGKINVALKAGFEYFGVSTRMEKKNRRIPGSRINPACFSSAARSELKYNGRKILGSAQRRYKNAILQHGSILLGPYHLKIVDFLKKVPAGLDLRKQAVSLSEISGEEIDVSGLKSCLRKGFETEFSVTFSEYDKVPEIMGKAQKTKTKFKI